MVLLTNPISSARIGFCLYILIQYSDSHLVPAAQLLFMRGPALIVYQDWKSAEEFGPSLGHIRGVAPLK